MTDAPDPTPDATGDATSEGAVSLPVTGHAPIDAALAGLDLDADVATHPARIAEVLEVVAQALNPTAQSPLPRLFLPEVGAGESAADEEHPESVVVAVAEAAGDAAVELDEAVDRLGPAVVRAVGVEVGQERRAPSFQGPAEPSDLRHGTGREGREDLLSDPPAGRRVAVAVGRSELLGTRPRHVDREVCVVSGDRCLEPGPLLVGQLLCAGT